MSDNKGIRFRAEYLSRLLDMDNPLFVGLRVSFKNDMLESTIAEGSSSAIPGLKFKKMYISHEEGDGSPTITDVELSSEEETPLIDPDIVDLIPPPIEIELSEPESTDTESRAPVKIETLEFDEKIGPFHFGFIHKYGFKMLLDTAEWVTFSSCLINVGSMVYPEDNDPNRPREFYTLKVESDKKKLLDSVKAEKISFFKTGRFFTAKLPFRNFFTRAKKFTPPSFEAGPVVAQAREGEIPPPEEEAISGSPYGIIVTPCPPWWDPFQYFRMGLDIDTLETLSLATHNPINSFIYSVMPKQTHVILNNLLRSSKKKEAFRLQAPYIVMGAWKDYIMKDMASK